MKLTDEKTGETIYTCDICGEVIMRLTVGGVIAKPNSHKCEVTNNANR